MEGGLPTSALDQKRKWRHYTELLLCRKYDGKIDLRQSTGVPGKGGLWVGIACPPDSVRLCCSRPPLCRRGRIWSRLIAARRVGPNLGHRRSTTCTPSIIPQAPSGITS